jgi:hypothetical protein
VIDGRRLQGRALTRALASGKLRAASIPAHLPLAPLIQFPVELKPDLIDAKLTILDRANGFDIALGKGEPEVLVRVTMDRVGNAAARALLLAHGGDVSVRAVALAQRDRVVDALRELALHKNVNRFADRLRSAGSTVRAERKYAERQRADTRARTRLLLNPDERRRSVRTVRG